MANLIGSCKFMSPINMENSFGSHNLSKNTESEMDYYLHDGGKTGAIEWIVDECDLCEGIGLWFDFDKDGKRTLVDYDGVFAIPTQALDLLEKHGVDVKDMRASMAE